MKELDKMMYYGANPETMETARILRERMTESEKKVWDRICQKQICGVRFRRQHPIAIFIADFYCHSAKLVVEIDGDIHNQQKEYDLGRTAEMERFHIAVIRFTNKEVELNIENVINNITKAVKARI